MNPSHAQAPFDAEAMRARVGAFLFLGVFLYFWISLFPFVDLTAAGIRAAQGTSTLLNQLLALAMFGCLLIYGLLHPMRDTILRPRTLMAAILLWFMFVSVISAHPMTGIKGVVLSMLITVNASVYLLLPTSERSFARLLAIGTLIVLAVAYFGVIFMPSLAIHQASELREPFHAGLWRGHFPHKNTAAVAMVIMAFFGLFVMKSWSRAAGLAILALACLFLVNTGGKTSSAMLPAILLVAWLFETRPFLRVPIALGGVIICNLFTLGSAVFRPLADFLTSFGVDATFTNRTNIWAYAIEALGERPLTGYGFRGFWQASQPYPGEEIEVEWLADVVSGHNSYLDIALTTGLPGLFLTLILLVILPLFYMSRMPQERQRSSLSRLFLRIWLYALFAGCLESMFFEGGSFLWFMVLVSIYGLRLQCRAALVDEPAPTPAHPRYEGRVSLPLPGHSAA